MARWNSRSVKQSNRVFAVGLVSAVLACAPLVHAAEPPSELAKGNAAFRLHDYDSALRYYDAAEAGGHGSALVDYNRGVAYYKLDRWEESAAAFERASLSAELAPWAYYNRGLVERARGERDEAKKWFKRAGSARGASGKLKELAKAALREQPGKRVAYRARRDPDDPWWSISANTRFGSDSNVFHSPNESYVDLATTGTPLVVPEEQQAYFSGLLVNGEARWGTHPYSRFHMEYQMDARRYLDSEFDNANASEHLFTLGNLMHRPDRFGRFHLRSDFVASWVNEKGFDRDDGSAEIVGGDDVSDRLKHTTYGPLLVIAQDIGRIRFGIDAHGFQRRYHEEIATADYSHREWLGGAFVEYRPWSRTTLGVDGAYYDRAYDQLPSKSEDGVRAVANPAVEYTYIRAGLTAAQRVGDSLQVSIRADLTDRADEFEGYDDYRRIGVGGRIDYFGNSVRAHVEASYRDYEFTNAFAFDDPTADEKTLQTTFASVAAEVRLTSQLWLTADAILNSDESTDLRSQYDRVQYSLGVRWEPSAVR